MRYKLFLLFIISFLFFTPSVMAETSSLTDLDSQEAGSERITDKHINAYLHKKGVIYTLQKPLEVAIGKTGYRDDYQIYKGKAYDGDIISFAGKSLGYFPADEMGVSMVCLDGPPTISRGCKEIPEGEIILRIPYFPNGKYVDFYNPQGEKIFTLDISSVAVCNENSICEGSKENEVNCPSDCKAQNPTTDEGKEDVSAQIEAPKNSNSSIIFLILIIIFVLVIIIGAVIFWLKRRKNYDNTQY